MNIITGYRGEPHITSQQKRNINIGIFDSGAHIIKGVGAELSATVISANEVEIADGMIMCEGCASEIARGTTESMTIDNGTQGKLRTDLIVARYNRNTSTGVEDMTLIVIKGTPSASSPQAPAYISGSIAEGDTTVDFPLYQVNLDGITITSVERLVDVVNIPSAKFVSTMRQRNMAAGYANTEKSLTVDFRIVPMDGDYILGSSFQNVSDGGYRALRSGILLVSAYAYVSGVNAGDVVAVNIGLYNGGWVWGSAPTLVAGTTERSCVIANLPVGVNADDIVYLRARNITAARGNVTSARMVAEYV